MDIISLQNGIFAVALALLIDAVTSLLFYKQRDKFFPLFNLPAKLALNLNHKLNRAYREQSQLYMRGLIVVSVYIVLFGLLPLVILKALNLSNFDQTLFDTILLSLMITPLKPARFFKDMSSYKKNISKISDLNDSTAEFSDEFAVNRAVIQSFTRALDLRMIGVAFYYLLFIYIGFYGIIGALFYTGFIELERTVRMRASKNSNFSKVISNFVYIWRFVPSRIIGILCFIAAFFTPGCNPFKGIDQVLRYSRHEVISNWLLCMFTGTLGIVIEAGQPYHFWIGHRHHSAKVTKVQLHKAYILYMTTYAISWLVLLCMLILVIA